MRIWMFVALAACTTTYQKDQPGMVMIGAVGATCPSGADAELAIELTTVGSETATSPDASCAVDQVLSVSDPTMQSLVTSCCYAVQCDTSVTAADNATLFQATCLSLACASLDLATFTPARARDNLAAHLPGCMLDPASTSPVEGPDVSCWYIVDERYTCSSGGLGS